MSNFVEKSIYRPTTVSAEYNNDQPPESKEFTSSGSSKGTSFPNEDTVVIVIVELDGKKETFELKNVILK